MHRRLIYLIIIFCMVNICRLFFTRVIEEGGGGNSKKLGNSILTVQYCISIEHHVTEFKVIRMAKKKKSAHFKGGSELKA